MRFEAGGETRTQESVTLHREKEIWTGTQHCSTGYRAKPVYFLSPFSCPKPEDAIKERLSEPEETAGRGIKLEPPGFQPRAFPAVIALPACG